MNRFDVLELDPADVDNDANAIELAHAVSSQVAAELAGIPVEWIEDRVVKYGELGVSNFSLEGSCQELLVRRTRNDP